MTFTNANTVFRVRDSKKFSQPKTEFSGKLTWESIKNQQ